MAGLRSAQPNVLTVLREPERPGHPAELTENPPQGSPSCNPLRPTRAFGLERTFSNRSWVIMPSPVSSIARKIPCKWRTNLRQNNGVARRRTRNLQDKTFSATWALFPPCHVLHDLQFGVIVCGIERVFEKDGSDDANKCKGNHRYVKYKKYCKSLAYLVQHRACSCRPAASLG